MIKYHWIIHFSAIFSRFLSIDGAPQATKIWIDPIQRKVVEVFSGKVWGRFVAGNTVLSEMDGPNKLELPPGPTLGTPAPLPGWFHREGLTKWQKCQLLAAS